MLKPSSTRWVFAFVAGACFVFGAARACAPQVKTQNPGYYRMLLGDFEITALSDGTFDLDTRQMLTNGSPGRVRELLARSFEGDSLPISVNAYLINTRDRLILVDTGAAALFGPTLGRLSANLEASGYRADQVDSILITHMHPDHIGGLVLNGQRAFRNATVFAERREAEFWLSASARKQAAKNRREFFVSAVAAIDPYARVGRFKQFNGPVSLFPGISAIPAPGHAPGHTIFAIESKGQKLVLWGDLMEIAAVQFIDPTVTIVFDNDAAAAVRQRPQAYADAAKGRYLVAAAHLPFPGIGHIRAEPVGYAWVPVTYDRVR
jgi:glyoxylase-like metal-dependent hydrolase (beta-lactamase superfamily II)